MKKLLFLAFLFLGPIFLSAQIEKGSIALSFNRFNPGAYDYFSFFNPVQTPNVFGVGLTTVKYDKEEEGEKYISAGLSTNLHYFFANNASLGIDLGGFIFMDREEEGMVGSFAIGPELRYYFELAPKLKLQLKANGTYGRANQKYDGEWEEYPLSGFSFLGGGAVSYFPASWFCLDIGAGYRYSSWESDGEFAYSTSRIMFDIGFTLFVKGGNIN